MNYTYALLGWLTFNALVVIMGQFVTPSDPDAEYFSALDAWVERALSDMDPR